MKIARLSRLAARVAPSSLFCHPIDVGSGVPTGRRLVVSHGRVVHLLPLDSILFITAVRGRVCIQLATGELAAEAALGTLTDALGPGFQRINRKMSVNMALVTEIRGRGRRGESAVVLQDGRTLPVTRLYAPRLRAWLLSGPPRPSVPETAVVESDYYRVLGAIT